MREVIFARFRPVFRGYATLATDQKVWLFALAKRPSLDAIAHPLPMQEIPALCQQGNISELALFGVVLHYNFHPDNAIKRRGGVEDGPRATHHARIPGLRMRARWRTH
ncbi:MAG TPA: hypothetical protein PKD55_12960, partial [Bellilinea sp.]|nr:hypothetical protein [Bellilinea sp.]